MNPARSNNLCPSTSTPEGASRNVRPNIMLMRIANRPQVSGYRPQVCSGSHAVPSANLCPSQRNSTRILLPKANEPCVNVSPRDLKPEAFSSRQIRRRAVVDEAVLRGRFGLAQFHPHPVLRALEAELL